MMSKTMSRPKSFFKTKLYRVPITQIWAEGAVLSLCSHKCLRGLSRGAGGVDGIVEDIAEIWGKVIG